MPNLYDKSLTKTLALAPGPCGVVSAFSAWKPEVENLASHGELLDILLRNGYSPVEAHMESEGIRGPCWAVPGIPESELVELGRDFGQECVLYVEDGKSRLVRA